MMYQLTGDTILGKYFRNHAQHQPLGVRNLHYIAVFCSRKQTFDFRYRQKVTMNYFVKRL